MNLVYLVGPPGAGKTTLMRLLTAGYERTASTEGGVPHDVLTRPGWPTAAEIGRQRGTFSGTDALSMSIHPAALAWITRAPYPLVYAEGARLATVRFLAVAASTGYDVHLIHLNPPGAVCEARRAARGTRQNPQWIRGAATKAANIAEQARAAGYHVTVMTSTRPPETLAQRLTGLVPAVAGGVGVCRTP